MYLKKNKTSTKLFCFISWVKSPIHVVLVSLLVDQFSSLFLILFWSTKKKVSSLSDQTKYFWSVSELFLVSLWFLLFKRDWPRIFCPVSETGQFFLVNQKMRNRLDNWLTKRLTKSTRTPLLMSKSLRNNRKSWKICKLMNWKGSAFFLLDKWK